MATLALLDKDGVLIGYKRCAKKDWKTKKGQVAVEDDPDLALDRYRWTGSTFQPLAPRSGEDDLLGEPTAMASIALGFLALSEGRPVPPETTAWAKRYMESIDGRTWLDLAGGKRK